MHEHNLRHWTLSKKHFRKAVIFKLQRRHWSGNVKWWSIVPILRTATKCYYLARKAESPSLLMSSRVKIEKYPEKTNADAGSQSKTTGIISPEVSWFLDKLGGELPNVVVNRIWTFRSVSGSTITAYPAASYRRHLKILKAVSLIILPFLKQEAENGKFRTNHWQQIATIAALSPLYPPTSGRIPVLSASTAGFAHNTVTKAQRVLRSVSRARKSWLLRHRRASTTTTNRL